MDNLTLTYPNVVDVKTMCSILHIGRQKAYRLLQTNAIYSKRIGNTYRIPLSSLYNYIYSNSLEKSNTP